MPHQLSAWRRLTVFAAAATMSLVGMTGAHAGSGDETGAKPSGPLADEMSRMLELQPGGVQVSDNAMAWDGGETVVVWPSPGESNAPAGLGANVRSDVASELGLATTAADAPAAKSWQTCSAGYYCFYSGSNYSGTRLEFNTRCSGDVGAWGFSDQASSWVSRNYNKVINAHDYKGGPHLWSMSPGQRSSYVGAGADNRMSYFSCRNV